MKAIVVIPLFFLFTNYSCKNKVNELNKYAEYRSYKMKCSEICRDIPKRLMEANTIDRIVNLSRQIKIDSLVNGTKDLEIRFWFDYSLDNKIQLILLKNVDLKWSGKEMKIRYQRDLKNDSIMIVEKNETFATPLSGWNGLVDSLLKLKVLTLPDCSLTPTNCQTASTDSHSVIVEIASLNQYRIYSYINPSFNRNSSPETQNIVAILKLLEYELAFKPIHKL